MKVPALKQTVKKDAQAVTKKEEDLAARLLMSYS